MKDAKFDLEERLLEYSVRIIHVTESINRSPAGVYVADQLLRSGTSPYGHHGEAEGAESRDDFIHKLRVCYKELREARRWLRFGAAGASRHGTPKAERIARRGGGIGADFCRQPAHSRRQSHPQET